jgi:hypothetical protein
LACRKGQVTGWQTLVIYVGPKYSAADLSPMELRLLPDPDPPLDMTTIWGEPIVVPGVRVVGQPAAR